MKSFREPVIYEIAGTGFLVDTAQQLLRQTNDLSNSLSFVHDMQDMGTHYHLLYNTKHFRPELYAGDNENITAVRVPQLTALDPEGMAFQYGKSVDEVRELSDYQVIVDESQLAIRRSGVLPMIDIMGEAFIVDLNLQELRHAANSTRVISLTQLKLSDEGKYFEAYYHPQLKMPVEIDPQLTEFPDHVVKISIPNELTLDPVAAAPLYGIDERKLLRLSGLTMHHSALVTPLAETNLPALIRENRDELKRQHREITQKIKPRQRPKF